MSGLALYHDEDAAVSVAWRGTELFRYVHVPGEPVLESPKPFLHPMRSLAGDVVSLYRPHDHIWHKGLYLGVANYGEHNVWGGHTWVPGEGYRASANHGRIRHEGFDRLELSGGIVRIAERLCWEGADAPDFPPAREVRTLRVRVLADAWVLEFASELTNLAGRPVVLGSPTTRGRPRAGYGGLFWRGPRSFTGSAEVVAPGGIGGDELMGTGGPWLAMRGRHDGGDRGSTLVFADAGADPRLPARWFVRVHPYACLGSAPFFDTEFTFEPGDTLRLHYRVAVANGLLDPAACAALAGKTFSALDEEEGQP